jgi:hypothetical protein
VKTLAAAAAAAADAVLFLLQACEIRAGDLRTARSPLASLAQPPFTPPTPHADSAFDGAADWRSASLPGPRRVRLVQLLEAPLTAAAMLAMSLFVIFEEDLKLAALPPRADEAMGAATAACLCAFLLELGARSPGGSRAAACRWLGFCAAGCGAVRCGVCGASLGHGRLRCARRLTSTRCRLSPDPPTGRHLQPCRCWRSRGSS